ncbi:MAG: UDP-N-acetylglucosamine pyrophosphorylase [Ruminococcaceae bacterium]|nr:UDP-N-acetylglucosamine pyrophosphorylase [Oscillospiraceae bacterium]
MYKNVKITDLLDMDRTIASELFENKEFPWEVLPEISEFILKIGTTLPADEYIHTEPDIWISKSAEIYPSALIKGPCIIGPETEVRHCAFIRGKAIIGSGCVVGNSCEIKNAILFDKVQVPHFNYVGDSVLGYRSHMGAGSVTSNVKSDKTLISVKDEDGSIHTGLKKFGAILGNNVEIGCNAVLCPGTVIGNNSTVYPTSMVRGYVPENSIFKGQNNIIKKELR